MRCEKTDVEFRRWSLWVRNADESMVRSGRVCVGKESGVRSQAVSFVLFRCQESGFNCREHDFTFDLFTRCSFNDIR
jgi:hypothetical protein